MSRAALALCAGTLLAFAPAARAQFGNSPEYGGGFHQHDGFFLQLTGGVGGLGSEASRGSSSLKLSGTGGLFSIAVGGIIAENLALGGELWGTSVSSPKVEIGSASGTLSGTGNGSFGLSGIGANITYYFMPVNIYLQATPSITTLTIVDGNGNSGSTERGFGIRLAVGKEWWVSQDWGVGLNLQYAYASNKDKGLNPLTFASNWFGVAFSATYN
jgi:hypothetical protein